jgi:hypothetical protein
MTEAQMAFLAERRKAKERENERSNSAPAENPGNSSSKYNGYGAFSLDAGEEEYGMAVSQLRVEDCWKCLTGSGSGTIGEFLVCRHERFGTVIELFKENSGGFALQRAPGAQVKYCSAMCSMQDESKPFAPQLVGRLSTGEGAKLTQGTSAGAWGKGVLRANRIVFSTTVKGRQGEPEETIELYLTVDGFIFLSA